MKTTNLRGVGGGGVLTVHVKQRVACATLEDFTSYIEHNISHLESFLPY